MARQKKRPKELLGTLAHMVKIFDATLEKLESKLEQVETSLRTLDEQGKEVQQRLSSQIIDLQKQIRQGQPTAHDPATVIPLEEGHMVDLEGLERKLEEKCAQVDARERELQELQNRIAEKLESLVAGTREKDRLLAAREVEINRFRQAMKGRMEAVETLVKKQAEVRNLGGRVFSFFSAPRKKNYF